MKKMLEKSIKKALFLKKVCYKTIITFHKNLKVGSKAPLFCYQNQGDSNAKALLSRYN